MTNPHWVTGLMIEPVLHKIKYLLKGHGNGKKIIISLSYLSLNCNFPLGNGFDFLIFPTWYLLCLLKVMGKAITKFFWKLRNKYKAHYDI